MKKKLLMIPLLLLVAAGLVFLLLLRAPELLPSAPELPGGEPSAPAQPVPTESAAPAEIERTPTPIPETPAVLSELMASNKTTLPDGDGAFSDWIELVNDSGSARDLEGCWLSDEVGEPFKWQFPALTLQPGERLLVFCSGKDRREGELHTNFSLGSDGETILLTSPEGYEFWRVEYPASGADQSVSFDGAQPLVSYLATPGFENGEAGREAFLSAADTHGALVISEAVLYNSDYAEQEHEYFDWVELKNVSSEPVKLSDYYLSDDRDELLRFRLPERTLAPGKTFLVFCSGDASLTSSFYCHAPFALSSQGDSLYLCRADGSYSDYVRLHDLPYKGSCGRLDGEAGFFYFKTPTPGRDNKDGFRSIAAMPTASPAEGVYEGVESLTVELSGEGEIYYTTDGAIPTSKSKRYEGPITLSKTGILRAVCVVEGKVVSDHATFSYFLNEGHELPIVSLVTEPRAIFGGAGIYTNYESDAKVDAHVSFFEDGGEGFAADCAVKLHGASSRKVWAKKNFKLIFKDRYGGDLHYDIFHNGITQFHSIVLRGGGITSMHMMRDELASLVANRVCEEPLALDSRYCAFYINGEYFGAYAIREAYSEQYVADHLGGSAESVQILRAPIKIGDPLSIVTRLIHLDMSQDENYEWACSVLDMESLCEWMALESYFNNLDPAGNLRYVSSDATGGRWRIAFFDLDIGMTSNYAGWEEMFNAGYQIGQITNSLKRNPAFVETLLECTSRLYYRGLNPDGVLAAFDELAEEISSEAQRDCRRWKLSYDQYLYELSVQRSRFNDRRTAWWLAGLQGQLRVSDEVMTQYFGDYPKNR